MLMNLLKTTEERRGLGANQSHCMYSQEFLFLPFVVIAGAIICKLSHDDLYIV